MPIPQRFSFIVEWVTTGKMPVPQRFSFIVEWVGWASRPSRNDGRDAHPTRMIKL